MLNKGFANILRVTWQQSVCFELIEGCSSIVRSLYNEGSGNPKIEQRSKYMASTSDTLGSMIIYQSQSQLHCTDIERVIDRNTVRYS